MKTTYGLPGRYKIEKPIGEGGTGQVLKVYDSVLDRNIALKILTKTDTDAYAALKKEFEILSKLDHPNLLKVHDFGFTANNIPYFTMDYMEGDNLRDHLKDNIADIIKILLSVFSALQYLHSKNILHGDIKPENIMISELSSDQITTKLMDFGLAIKGSSSQIAVSGTLHYLAPEILAESRYSERSDLYALGITIIDCITNIDIPVAHKITDDFYKEAYLTINKKFGKVGIRSPSSLSGFIVSLCHIDTDQRPETAAFCLQSLSRIFKLDKREKTTEQGRIFVGRKENIDLINDFFETEYHDKNTLLFLGKTGIGKKSLIRQALIIGQLKGYATIDTSDKIFNSDSFIRFINALGSHLPSASKDMLKKRHNDILESFSQNIDSGLSSKEQDMAPVIYDNIVQFLHESSKDQNILISIPDIMRFGPDFIRFITHMIYETAILGSKVKIIISRNTDISSAKIKSGQLKSISESENILEDNVEPFTVDELSDLLQERFGDTLFNDRELKKLIEKSEGIPLYLDRIIDQAIRSSVIYKDGDGWFLDRKLFSSFDIPDTFAEIVEKIFAGLDRDKRSILQMIASYGEPISVSDLSSLLNTPENELLDKVTPLIDNGILSINHGIVDFTNPSYRSQIVKSASYRLRINYNRIIATYLQNRAPQDPVRITRHYIAAQDIGGSIDFGLRAVEDLISKYGYYDAYELLSKISSLAKRKGSTLQQNRVLEHLVSIEIKVGLVAEAAEHYEDLIKNTSDLGQKAIYMTGLGKLMHYYICANKYAYRLYSEAFELAERFDNTDLIIETMILQGICKEPPDIGLMFSAAEMARKSNDNLYAYALSRIIHTQRLSGNIDEMNKAIDKLLYLLKTREIKISIKRQVLHTLCLAYFFQGDYKNHKLYIDKLIQISHTTFNEIDNIYYLSTLGGHYYIQGDSQNLIATLEKVISLSKKFNLKSSALIAVSNLTGTHIDRSEYDLALALIKDSWRMIEKKSIGNVELVALLKPLTIYVKLGKYFSEKYKPLSVRFQKKAKQSNDLLMLGHGYLLKSTYHYQNLALSRAVTQASKALEYFRKTSDRDDIVETLAHLCIYELEKENIKEATACAMEARRIFDEIHCEYLRPFLLLAEGSLASAKEDTRAENILKDAHKFSVKMGTRENTWQIQRQLAIYYYRSGDTDKAVAMYRETIETIRQITESISEEEIKRSYLSLPFRKRVFEEIKTLKNKKDSEEIADR